MKFLRVFSLLSATVLCASPLSPVHSQEAGKPQGCTLRIHVDGLRNSIGWVGTAVFAVPEGWPEGTDHALRHGPTPIASGQRQATALWPDLPAGDYAVVAIHDENMNHKLDRNLVGWPKEGFGFANNPHVGLSAPSFQAAIVHLACPSTETVIHMQYK